MTPRSPGDGGDALCDDDCDFLLQLAEEATAAPEQLSPRRVLLEAASRGDRALMPVGVQGPVQPALGGPRTVSSSGEPACSVLWHAVRAPRC